MNNFYETSLLWIVLFPLVGAIANGLVGRFAEKRLVGTVAVGSVFLSFIFALVSFIELSSLRAAGAENPVIVADVYRWFELEVHGRTIGIDVRFAMDSFSGVMTLMVTGIGLLIHIYSLGYMSEEKSYARFFAYLNLFMASMLILVLASNFPLLFVGWEGVGLCS
jgi:NADH-quinone oxidoreductase subunit L